MRRAERLIKMRTLYSTLVLITFVLSELNQGKTFNFLISCFQYVILRLEKWIIHFQNKISSFDFVNWKRLRVYFFKKIYSEIFAAMEYTYLLKYILSKFVESSFVGKTRSLVCFQWVFSIY